MTTRITNALERLFEKHRIVFWYDDANNLRGDFDSVDIDGVEKVELANNEFGLKYRMLRECPTQKFPVFKPGEQPADEDSWLLDVQLANTEFRTDQASLWLTELELPHELKPIVTRHEFFFNSVRRRDYLKASISKTDGFSQILLKMLAVCADADPRLDSGWKILLDRGLDVFQPYEMKDAFSLANRVQRYKSCKAFEVTYLRQ